jgi:hypothetical protein
MILEICLITIALCEVSFLLLRLVEYAEDHKPEVEEPMDEGAKRMFN